MDPFLGRTLRIIPLLLAASLLAADLDRSAGPPREEGARPAAEGGPGERVPPAPTLVAREAYLMGTILRVGIEAPERARGLLAIEDALREVRRLEHVLSTWRENSDLARVNSAAPHLAVPVSPELMGLLEEARRWRNDTDGAFDPGVGALVDAWDLRGRGRIPTDAELARARGATGLDRFRIDPESGSVERSSARAWIDSGGFGKGAALRAAGRLLAARGVRAGLLDFGGQVLALGAPRGESAWPVAVADPARRDRPVAILRLAGASASTSGQSERFVEVSGRRFGHILDPRSGQPVPAWGSVTVVAEDPLAADALSTGLFVLGPSEALRWARGQDHVGVLVLVATETGLRADWNDVLSRRGVEIGRDLRRGLP